MGLTSQEQLLVQHFAKYITDHKKDFIKKVLSQRTRQVTVVLEDIYQSQNSSAVVRTCECLGLQDVHIIENTSAYQVNTRVLKGSNRWLNLVRYRTPNVNNTEACMKKLRANGYMIYAASPEEDGVSIHELDPTNQRMAIMFGNEHHGVSEFALAQCDRKVKIPMYGFTESLNISVSVAIAVSAMIAKLHSTDWTYGLSDEEQASLTLAWYRKVVRKSDVLEREFLRTIQ